MTGFLGLVAATLALPVGAGTIGVRHAADDVYPPRPASLGDPPPAAPARLTPDRPTVAIVLGEEGASAADTLAPYEVFATTGAFDVVTVAPSHDPVVLTGGLDVVPDLTFEELAEQRPGPPDVIVVPQVHGSTDAVVTWLRAQVRAGAPLVMGVCVGAEVLAEAGLLDGRPATSHWLKLIGLRRSDPDVDWRDGVRFVDDGDVITTAAVLSGIDGSLRVVERLVGAGAADRVADRLRWNGYRPGEPRTVPTEHLGTPDAVALLSAAYRWHRPTTGVLLSDGVGEIELAAAMRPYSELSYLARLRTVGADGAPVRSRHGLTLLPRSDLRSAAPDLDRLLVPGTGPDTSVTTLLRDADVPVVALHRPDEFAVDGALRDIAATYDVATARWVAKSLQYPPPDDDPDGRAWPWLLTATPLLLAGLGLGAALLLRHLLRRSRRAR